MGHFSVSSSSHWASLQSTCHLLSFAGDNWFNNKYSMCTVASILSHTFDASVSISLVTRPILDGWAWVVTRLHLAGLASHSWHSSTHLKSWITSHFCEPWLLCLLYTMRYAVRFVRSWQRPMWLKCPASVVLYSAMYLLTINLSDMYS